MNTRNFSLIRSITFGFTTKLVGSLTVFLGIPLIGHSLSAADYAQFLHLMSAGTIITLFFGAAGVVSTRQLAMALSGGDEGLARQSEARSVGLFLLLGATSLAVSGAAVLMLSANWLYVLVLGLCILVGISSWGDTYRVAARSDHISSFWQLLGNVFLLLLLIPFARHGLWTVALIYFGTPALIQLSILVHVWLEKRSIAAPDFSLRGLLGQSKGMSASIANSGIEYLKIFGSGLVVARVGSDATYGLYVTIVLLIARFVNPLSLLTRPLLPAFLDAVQKDDQDWLTILAYGIIGAAGSSLAICILIGFFVDPLLVAWILPGNAALLSRPTIVFSLLFLWGHGFTTLMAPLYFAQHREFLFCGVNGLLVVAGIVSGALLMVKFGSLTMLGAVSAAVVISAIALVTLASAKLSDHRDRT